MLHDVQQAFAGAIRSGSPATALPHLAGPDAAARLAVYLRHHRASLTTVIIEGFPATGRLAGEGFLAYAADRFVAQHPPASPVMALYGADFPAFLAGFSPCADIPWIADVAGAEWAMQEAARAASATALDAAMLAQAGIGEASCLVLDPAARIVTSGWQLAVLLRAGLGGALPDAPLAPAPSAVLIRRGAEGVTFTALPPDHGAFLAALIAGAAVAAAAEAAFAADPGFDLAAAFRFLAAAHLVVRVLNAGDLPDA